MKRDGTSFTLDDKKYFFIGANYWEGMNLGAPIHGNLGRLKRDLDDMKSVGINNLRIMGSTQGPDDRPKRIVPSLETEKGKYNNDIFQGLDTFLDEMDKRSMKAVVVLNNFWEWSGGFGQIAEWYSGHFDSYPTGFYGNKDQTDHLKNFINVIVNRVNTVNGRKYKEDPTIMAWQLANEPRSGDCHTWAKWVNDTSYYIKSIDSNHLVSIGNEGTITSCSSEGNTIEYIDYITFHAWAQNWGWYTPYSEAGLDRGISSATQYIDKNVNGNIPYGKPMVLEEFGLARDKASYDPSATVNIRDKYFKAIFDHVLEYANNSTMSGANFWAYGGEGRPKNKGGEWWKKGDDFIGDPPHERQGWYSIYNTDITTKTLISEYTDKFNSL